MECKRCGGGLALEESNGGADGSDMFEEVYECPNGHRGSIMGVVGNEEIWETRGVAFDD